MVGGWQAVSSPGNTQTDPETRGDAPSGAEGDVNTSDVESLDRRLPENIQIAEATQSVDAAARFADRSFEKEYLLRWLYREGLPGACSAATVTQL